MKYQILFNASTSAKNSMNIFFKHKRCQDLLRTQRATSKIGVWTWAMAAELAQRFFLLILLAATSLADFMAMWRLLR